MNIYNPHHWTSDGSTGNKGAIINFSFNADGSIASQKYEMFDPKPVPKNYPPLKYQSLSFR